MLLYKEQQRECENQQPESRWTWNQRRMAETLRQHIQQPNRILPQTLKHGSQILIVVVPMQIWTFSPALHLHSCHPWVFPLKSRWITSSNLPPTAGKGRAECSLPASEPVQVHARVPGSRIWPLQIQELEHGKTNDLWRHTKRTRWAVPVSQNVLFGKMMLRTVAALCSWLSNHLPCPMSFWRRERGRSKVRWRIRIKLGWLLYYSILNSIQG